MMTREGLLKSFRMAYTHSNVDAYNTLVPQEVVDSVIDYLILDKPQEPVEARVGSDMVWGGEVWKWYKCGACEKAIGRGDKYCRHCGRAVKWE